jgi:hypothetical protein
VPKKLSFLKRITQLDQTFEEQQENPPDGLDIHVLYLESSRARKEITSELSRDFCAREKALNSRWPALQTKATEKLKHDRLRNEAISAYEIQQQEVQKERKNEQAELEKEQAARKEAVKQVGEGLDREKALQTKLDSANERLQNLSARYNHFEPRPCLL